MDVAISNNGSVIYVTDKIKGVLGMDRQGTQLYTFRSHELEEPNGICVDNYNNVIVCGYMSNNIIELNETLDNHNVLVNDSEIISPNFVSYDGSSSTILVVCSNKYAILTLRKQ